MGEDHSIHDRYELVKPFLDEHTRRIVLAAEARVLGWGGVSIVSKETGVTRETISRGCKELDELPPTQAAGRIRKPGGGRKKLVEIDPTLMSDLDSLIEPTSRGDPESPLRWTTKSTRSLARELQTMGHKISHSRVADLLHIMEYSLQANKKTIEGSRHPDRDAQFQNISTKCKDFMVDGQPVVSVDAKKKELVGNFKNNGRVYRPKKDPVRVLVHDFEDKELGKVNPYGIYDINRNVGWVNVGIDHDTAAFAVASIRSWWHSMGAQTYSEASKLLITADAGGSNGYRIKMWKTELQKFANESGLEVSVCHLPPGASKWNKIEHKLFSYISQNWRGRPLISHEFIINLIAATKTQTGLRVGCQLDTNQYPKGIKISDDELELVNIKKDEFHGEWNYTIYPNEISPIIT